MSRTTTLIAPSAVLLFSLLPASAVTIESVPVGNVGNAERVNDFETLTFGI